ncbi:MAG: C39 family peptidase [Planctomycetota bacterium]
MGTKDEPPSTPELLSFAIQKQPDAAACGPTCLHAIYRYWGDDIPLDRLLAEVRIVKGGGTLGVLLALDALARGYRTTIVTWNLLVFDPSWFTPPGGHLKERLVARAEAREEPKLRFATRAYVEYLDRGGRVEYRDLEPALLRHYLRRGVPILTGLSATFLYRESRERAADGEPDDIAGDSVGHFAVLVGHSSQTRKILVADPLHPNPLSESHIYPVNVERVIGAIYLGVLTYDANLVIIEPRHPRVRP